MILQFECANFVAKMSVISKVQKKRLRLLLTVLFCSTLIISCNKKQSQVSFSSLELDMKGLHNISSDLEDRGIHLNKAPNVEELSSMVHQEVNETIDWLKNYVDLNEQVLVSLEMERIQGNFTEEGRGEGQIRQNLSNARAYLDIFITSDLITRSSVTDQIGSPFQISQITKENVEVVSSQIPLNISDFSENSDSLDEEKLLEAIDDVLNLKSLTGEELKTLAQTWEDLASELNQSFQKLLYDYIHSNHLDGAPRGGRIRISAEDILPNGEGEQFSNSALLAMQTLKAINSELEERGLPISDFSKQHNLVHIVPLYQKESTLDRDIVMQLFSLQEAVVSYSLGLSEPLNTETGLAIYKILMSLCGNVQKQKAKYENDCPLRGKVEQTPSVNQPNDPSEKSDTFQMDFQLADSNINGLMDLSVKSIFTVLVGTQTVLGLGSQEKLILIETRIELTSGEVYNLFSVKRMAMAPVNPGVSQQVRIWSVQIYSQNDHDLTLVGGIQLRKRSMLRIFESILVENYYSINSKILTSQEVEDVFVGEKLVTRSDGNNEEKDEDDDDNKEDSVSPPFHW